MMVLWWCALGAAGLGAALCAILAARAPREIGSTIESFDELRRDLRLAVVELRVEQERIARRVAYLRRHGPGQAQE